MLLFGQQFTSSSAFYNFHILLCFCFAYAKIMKLLKLVSFVSRNIYIFIFIMYLGKNIKTIREYWELNQTEFGLLVGATRGMIMQYENRGTMPKKETVSRIVSLTGFTDDLLINTEIDRDDIEPLPQEDALFIENYRNNPDDYANIDNSETPSF